MQLENKARSLKLLDGFFLLAASLFLVAAIPAAFGVGDKFYLSPAWVFGTGAAVLFFVVVGWPYRSKLQSAAFASFFLTWMALHVVVYLFILGYLGFLYYIPAVLVELWIGYTIAIQRFGPPTDSYIR